MTYVTVDRFTQIATFPQEKTTRLEQTSPGFIAGRLAINSASIDGELARYDVPFKVDIVGEYPLIVVGWVVNLTALDCWLRLGRSATDEDVQITADAARRSRDEITAAANAANGLWGLPLRASTDPGIRPTPQSYTVSSPFLDQRQQRERGRREDEQGHGTYRRRGRIG